jgi:filamentous hemagglutinin family protein
MKRLPTTITCASVVILFCAVRAVSAPTDGVVRAGNATISTSGVTTTITQTSDRAVIDWASFNVASTESVIFSQPNAQSAALNRVSGPQLSQLHGTLSANGQVWLVNPNGILIGSGATINAASFIASTANIGTDAFMTAPSAASGRYAFNELTTAARTGSIVNAGTITVADQGLVALVAPSVRNSGTITARLGKVQLASASHFTLDLFGDDLVRVAVNDSIASAMTDVQGNAVTAQIEAGGQLTADGGHVVLLAVPTAAGVVSNAINLSGVVRAQSVASDARGTISLLANDGRITIAGTADASARAAGVPGGTITSIGSDVRVASTGRLNASGSGGGGVVTIGGRYTADEATATARAIIEAGAEVSACGTSDCTANSNGGAAGRVRVWSRQGTQINGVVDVSGSANGSAGTAELLSNEGAVELGSAARVRVITGVGQQPGLVVVVGETLAVDTATVIDTRDSAGGYSDDVNRPMFDDDPNTPDYFVPDADGDGQPDVPRFGVDQAVVFHAYAQGGLSGYLNNLPPTAPPGNIFVRNGLPDPAGSVRPNGGAPFTNAVGTADALAAIPVTLTPPLIPPPDPPASTPQSGTDFVNTQVSDTAHRLSRDSTSSTDHAGNARPKATPSEQSVLMISGGPGVARSADLGRSGDDAGVRPDVFGVNYHVLAPTQSENDASLSDYLCKTPYSRNGCSDAAHIQRE